MRRDTGRGALPKVLFFGVLALSVVFLVMSLVSWNPLLGLCALGLGLGLTRFLDVVGIRTDKA